MNKVVALTKRNCLLFLRSRATVFFSFLSSIILIALYFLFIAKSYAQGFGEIEGLLLTNKQLNSAIYAQMIVGVLVVNSVSLSTGMFSIMATDFETRKVDAVLLTNVKPIKFLLSYLISSVVVSFGLNLLMWIASVIIIGATTGVWIGFGAVMAVIGVLAITTFVSCSIMLMFTTIVKSSNAIGVINGVLGTLLGFLCGIYMPYSMMGKGTKIIGSLLPFTHLTVWLKNIVLNNILKGFGLSADVILVIKEQMFSAQNVGLLGMNSPLWLNVLLGVVFASVCVIVASWLISKMLHSKKPKKVKRSLAK